MIVNITSMDTFDDIIQFIGLNPDIAKWANDRAIIFEDGKVYISSIEFFDKDDCLFYSLKFGLR